MGRTGKKIWVAKEFDDVLENIRQNIGISKIASTRIIAKEMNPKIHKPEFSIKMPQIKFPKPLPKNKKGQLLDFIVPIFIIFLFIVAAFSVITYNIWTKAKPTLESQLNSDDIDNIDNAMGTLDYMFGGLVFMILIGMVVLSFFVKTHPVFTGVFILFGIIGLVFSVVFANAYELGFVSSSLDTSTFTIQNFIFDNLPLVYTIFFTLSLIILFGKSGGG